MESSQSISSNKNQSRYTKRQESRRCILKTIATHSVERHHPSAALVAEMISAIDCNRVADFSLSKLSNVFLDCHYLISDYSSDCALRLSPRVGPLRYQSILSYAIDSCRYRIAYSLLRAGANPALSFATQLQVEQQLESSGDSRYHHTNTTETTIGIRLTPILHKFNAYPPPYMVWVLKLLHLLSNYYCYIQLFYESMDTQRLISCELCERTRDYSNWFDFLMFAPCHHVLCHSCFWKNYHRLDAVEMEVTSHENENEKSDTIVNENTMWLDDKRHRSLESSSSRCCSAISTTNLFSSYACCLVCSRPVALDVLDDIVRRTADGGGGEDEVSSSLFKDRHLFSSRMVTRNPILPCLLDMGPLKCMDASMELWNALPDNRRDHNGSTNSAAKSIKGGSSRFEPMHISDVTMQSLGTTRTERNDTFMSAVISRKGAAAMRRVAVLVEVGVDINHRDEYGMTALMWASWLNYPSIVKVLLNAGADINAPDPLGRSALSMAVSRRDDNQQIVQIIQQFASDHEIRCFASDVSTRDSVLHLSCDGDDDGADDDGAADDYVSRSHTGIYDGLSLVYKCHCKVSFRNSSSNSRSRSTRTGSVGDAYMLIPPLIMEPFIPDWSSFSVHGAEDGAYCIDNAFSQSFLNDLLDIFHSIPIAPSTKPECASRSYFCDISGNICEEIASVVRQALISIFSVHQQQQQQHHHPHLQSNSFSPWVKLFPQMRFLHYSVDGSSLDPHVDLSRVDVTSKEEMKSTHTTILYLTDCNHGGGTALLRHLRKVDVSSNAYDSQCNRAAVATVCPRYGRLLVFPHNCPHEGLPIYASAPKILLRGEISISYSS